MSSIALLSVVLLSSADVSVTVTTAKGEVVEGTWKGRSVEIETEFGSAEVLLEKLGSIVFGEPDVIETTSGVELRGKVTLKRLVVVTKKGRRSLRRKDLRRIDVGTAGGDGGSFAGRWMTSFGPMTLKQQGAKVAGSYGWAGDSPIEGRVKGKRLEFTYVSNGQELEGWFELWEDGDTFAGKWVAKGGRDGFWGAYRWQPKKASPKPGVTTEGLSESGLRYHLHVPRGYDPKRKYDAVVLLHGSNMNSASYVATVISRWPALAKDFILIGLDGETLSPGARPDALAFNYTYINFGGMKDPVLWRRRQSPALVAEALRQLEKELPVDRWYVGGHSQGGFLTYAVAMYFPELVAGVFPMACGLLNQCAPDVFDDAKTRARQRAVAFAVVHGENDPVVGFSSGQVCHESFLDARFPKLRFFHPPVNHWFSALPVEGAVRWLVASTSENPADRLVLAEEAAKDGRWRDVCAGIQELAGAKLGGAGKTRIQALERQLERAAKAEVARLDTALATGGEAAATAYWRFRDPFDLAPAARSIVKRYDALRSTHESKAKELFDSVRRERDEGKRKAAYQEIVERYWASSWYPIAKRAVTR